MGILSHRGELAIAEIIFYTPALPLAVYAGFKHGFGKSAGWYFVILLALVRIIGAAMQIAVDVEQSTNTGLIAGAIAMSSIGTGPLCLAALGLIKRLYDGMRHKIVPPRVFWLLGILPLVGLILSIVGGVNAGSGSIQDLKSALQYLQVAAILYLVVVVLEIGVAALMAVHLGDIVHNERKLYYALVLSLPFLLVRIVYSVVSSYSWLNPTSPFNPRSGSIFVQAFMGTMEEFIIVALYLAAAMLTEKKPRETEADHVGDRYDSHQAKEAYMQSYPMQTHPAPTYPAQPTHHMQQNGTVAV